MRAIYPGSFDPFTLGHLNILERALKLFGHIDIVIANNNSKDNMFTTEQRLQIVALSVAHLKTSVSIISCSGLISDYINEQKIEAIIRGIRGSTDLDYEIKLEQYNSKASHAETIYLTPQTEHLNTSSTLVRMFLETHRINLAAEYMRSEALNYIESIRLKK